MNAVSEGKIWNQDGVFAEYEEENVVSVWNIAVQIGIRTSPTMLNSLCNANNTYRFLYVHQICGDCLRSMVKVFLNSPTFVILTLIQ
jgi:hypothetical protein